MEVLVVIKLTATVWKEEDMFVAKCVELRVASQGKTKLHALRNLREAIELYLEDEDISQFPSSEIVPLRIAV